MSLIQIEGYATKSAVGNRQRIKKASKPDKPMSFEFRLTPTIGKGVMDKFYSN